MTIMAQIRRVDMKRKVKPLLTKSLLSIYEGKYCKRKQMKLEFKRYANEGFLCKLDNFSFGVTINIYQDGEVSYIMHSANIQQERIVCLEAAETYDEYEVEAVVQNMIADIKQSVKDVFGEP